MNVPFPLLAAVVLVVASSVGGAVTSRQQIAGATDNVVWPKTTVVWRPSKRFNAPPTNGRQLVIATTTTARYAHESQNPVSTVSVPGSTGPTDLVVNRFLVIPETRCRDGQTVSSTGQCVDVFEEDDYE